MTDEQVRAIVAATLREQKRVEDEELDRIVLKAISMILTSFGINDDDRKEFRADLIHLRRWRRSVEQPSATRCAVVTGVLGALSLAIQDRARQVGSASGLARDVKFAKPCRAAAWCASIEKMR